MAVDRRHAQSDNQEASIAMLVCDADRSRIASLLEILRDSGIVLPIVRPDQLTGLDTLVVVVSQALVTESEALETLRGIKEDGETQLVPLLLEDAQDSVLFSDLSQVRLASGLHEAARILNLVLRVGPHHLVPWKRLVSQSRTWMDGGRSVGGLLSRSDTRLATSLLTEPIASFDAEGAQPLRELVVASRRRLRFTRYRRFLVIGTTAIILVVVGIVAADQQNSAEAARTEADRSASISESSRLADLAISYAENDPDIPWILAADANRLSAESQAATSAAVRVMASIPVHRSLQLGRVPTDVSVAENGTVSVVYSDVLQLDLVNLRAMEVSKTFENVESGKLSESGTRLALLRPGGELAILALTDKGRWLPDVSWQDVEAFDWRSDGSLLVAQGKKLSLVDFKTSDSSSWEIPTTVLPVSDMASEDESLVVLGPEHVAVFDLESKSGDARVQQIDPGAVSISASGGRVYLQFANRVSLPVGIARNGENEVTSRTMSIVSAAPIGEEWVAVTSAIGQIGFLDARDLKVGYIVDSHRGVAWALDYSSRWGLVSVGGDMMLRVWEIDPTMRSIGADYGVTARYDNARFRDANRHRLQATGNPERINLVHVDTDTGLVLDRSTLEVLSKGRISLLWDVTLPTRTEGQFVTLLRERREALIADIVRSETKVISFEFGFLPRRVMIAASPETDAIAVATGTFLSVWTESLGWSETRFESERDLILLEVDDSGRVTAVDSRGNVESPSESWDLNLAEGQRLTAIVPIGPSSYIGVDARGNLLRFISSAVEGIGSVGPDAEVFDVSLSETGNLVAAIGPAATRFFSIKDRRIVAEISGEGGASVVDVLFDEQGSSGVYVRSNGVVGRFDVPEDVAELLGVIEAARPRALTEDEEQMLAVDRND